MLALIAPLFDACICLLQARDDKMSAVRTIAAVMAAASVASVRFELSNVFGDSMVLQRDQPASIWGWASFGSPSNSTVYGLLVNQGTNETVAVTAEANSANGGLFVLTFPAQPGGPARFNILVADAPIDFSCSLHAYNCVASVIPLQSVMFGDVLFCHGQSNMQVNVAFAFNATAELNDANALGGLVRVFQVEASVVGRNFPMDNVARIQIPWSYASNMTLPTFSATCWYTAKALALERTGANATVPLGLVASTWGGTCIKAWTSAAVGQQCSSLYPFAPNETYMDCELFHSPCNQSSLYNAMVAPFTVGPMRVAAFVWFQGENDCNTEELAFYSCQLRNMVSDMRATFGSPGAHWTTVQLAPYTGGPALGPFRDMQCTTTWAIPNAACAVIDDDGDPLSPIGSVHSRNKQLVGRRVAAGILASVYGSGALSHGPVYRGATVATVGGSMYANVTFDPASLGGGLVYVPPHVDPWQNSSRCPTEIGIAESSCEWTYIVGSDGLLYNATVAISADGTMLQLSCEGCAPSAVTATGTRFGYNAWPVVNIYNALGYPLVPWYMPTA